MLDSILKDIYCVVPQPQQNFRLVDAAKYVHDDLDLQPDNNRN